MPIITAIKPQKNGKRVNIYLDYKFGFGLDLENFVKSGLKVEQNLTDGEVEKIVKKADFQKTYDNLLRFATLRPRSENEIKIWFKRKKTSGSLTDELMNRLKKLELIDDKKFARWWIDQRIQFKFKSKRELEFELRSKGINKIIINEVLGETEIDEEKIVRDLLEKNRYKWDKLNKLEARKKMSEYLARKGFSWEIISKIIKHSSD